MSNYEIWLTTDVGVRSAQLDNIISLTASKAVNSISWCSLSMPASFDINLIRPDRMIQIWRQPTGGALGLWGVYFLRRWKFSTEGSSQRILLEGPDVKDLLRRRIVAAFAGSAQAEKTGAADDLMKEVVTESIADGVAPTPDAGTRVWANLTIAGDLSAGPSITKSFPFDKLLTSSSNGVLVQLAQAARVAGTEVFFDVVPNAVSSNSISFIFQTYTGQPGQDVTDRVVFDQQRGNMRDPSLEYDYSEEGNYVYGAGQGEGEARNIQQVYDTARYGASIWNRCEDFADARNQSTDDGVIAAARNKLEDGRPRIHFTATPVDTDKTRFGRDWDYGYKVRARYQNVEFDTIIRAVTLSVDGSGKETIQTRLEYEA